jgi:hypothetical protein
MSHLLRCRCGRVQGLVTQEEKANRGVCYCRDCQAYAHALGNASAILDAAGGSDVIATMPKYVTITQGKEELACLSLSEKGMLRWYAACCKTPIGNTQRDYRISYVGLLHNCLEHSSVSLDSAFGPVRMRVNTKSAKGKISATSVRTVVLVVPFLASVLRARMDCSYRKTPFFDPVSGKPVAYPSVLSASERERVMSAVSQ